MVLKTRAIGLAVIDCGLVGLVWYGIMRSRAHAAEKAIMLAAERGDFDKVQSIAGKKPKLVNTRDFLEHAPLQRAVEKGHKEIVLFLLNNGAEVNAITHHGNTALDEGAKRGNLDIVELLLANGATVTTRR